KYLMVCGLPSSESSNWSLVRLGISRPFLSFTLKNTLTTSTWTFTVPTVSSLRSSCGVCAGETRGSSAMHAKAQQHALRTVERFNRLVTVFLIIYLDAESRAFVHYHIVVGVNKATGGSAMVRAARWVWLLALLAAV